MAKTKEQVIDDLGSAIAETLNKKGKADSENAKVVYFLDRDLDAPTNVTEWVSTGSTMLDFIISNREHGGFPVGKISSISGMEQSGKSLLASHALASTQKRGGLAVYIDTEFAADPNFLRAIGVDLSQLLYVPQDTLEGVFESLTQIIERARSSSKNQLITIVIDSIAGATTNEEMSADFSKGGYATGKSLILSKAMRKITSLIANQRICVIFTNQLRHKMDAMPFGDKYVEPGGKAIPFHSSVRLRLTSIGKIKGELNGVETVIGAKTQVKVEKNRLGPPQRTCDYEVYFASGIRDESGWLDAMKRFGIAKQSGAWYSVQTPDGLEHKFQSKDFKKLIYDNHAYREHFYKLIAEKMVIPYDESPENVTLDLEESEDSRELLNG